MIYDTKYNTIPKYSLLDSVFLTLIKNIVIYLPIQKTIL